MAAELASLSSTDGAAPKAQLMAEMLSHLMCACVCVCEIAINGWHLKIKIDIIGSIKIIRWVANGALACVSDLHNEGMGAIWRQQSYSKKKKKKSSELRKGSF